MNIIEKEVVKAYHRARQDDSAVYALGYRSDDEQCLRFDALCQWGDMSEMLVLDMGCGYGDFKVFLDQRYSSVTYLGLDFVTEFIDTAGCRFAQDHNCDFLCIDFEDAILPKVDVVVASGSLNYRSTQAGHPWSMIKKMWQAAEKGIAFNLLHRHCFAHSKLLCGYESAEVMDFCRQFTDDVRLVSGYLPDDFTILMRR